MVTYKLIKSYPGSPEVGVYFTLCAFSFKENKESSLIYERCGLVMNADRLYDLQDYPEFWELCKKPTGYNVTLVKRPSGIREIPQDHNYYNLISDCKIESVKRTSDDVIFSVGDIIKDENNKTKTILEIKINSGFMGGVELVTDNGSTALGYEKNQKAEVIFTADDGKHYFHVSEEVYLVDKNTSKMLNNDQGNGIGTFLNGWYWKHLNNGLKTEDDIWKSSIEYIEENYISFSSKEKAEEYILFNTPCLSGQDVIDYIEKQEGKLNGIHPAFIELLKSKQ